ncbi:thermonuclease family protein [Microbacterium sp. NPDC078428]|uniref:thermonuclease family protein n=1 Tax=Microbacterium sp. NPDC078428 TaxID=3364190 RepID=UPI0037CB06E3
MLLLAACTPAPAPTAPASSSPSPPATTDTVTFAAVIDGDTIETSAGTVRIIGIDTPERGECGYDEASAALGRLVSVGDPLVLSLPAAQNDRDDYGRMLRSVATADGTDLGRVQIDAGNAVARYDSSDGYPAHPLEAEYRAAQTAVLDADRNVITAACRAGAAPAPSLGISWWQAYSSCTKLSRNEAGHPSGPFDRDDPSQAAIYEWFAYGTGNNGDGDGDGLACE